MVEYRCGPICYLFLLQEFIYDPGKIFVLHTLTLYILYDNIIIFFLNFSYTLESHVLHYCTRSATSPFFVIPHNQYMFAFIASSVSLLNNVPNIYLNTHMPTVHIQHNTFTEP